MPFALLGVAGQRLIRTAQLNGVTNLFVEALHYRTGLLKHLQR